MIADEKIIQRIKKVRELAERGSPGEKECAQKKLKELEDKYEIPKEEELGIDYFVNNTDYSEFLDKKKMKDDLMKSFGFKGSKAEFEFAYAEMHREEVKRKMEAQCKKFAETMVREIFMEHKL